MLVDWVGDDTAKHSGRLSLNPIRHIDPFLTVVLPLVLALSGMPIFGGAKPVPFNPSNLRFGEWGAALVALAGPLVNFVIAFLAFGFYVTAGPDGVVGYVSSAAVAVNLGFFVFNMLPIPPLDGSRVLYALAPDFARRGMEAVERYGVLLVFGLVLVASPLIGGFMAAVIGGIIKLFSVIFGISS
jgi:Zn-dependent protease